PRALVAKRKRLGGAAASRTLDSFPARARSYRPALRGTAMNSFSSFLICLFFACSLAGSRGTENTPSRAQSPEPGYHRSIPTKPLPPTLDPEQFRGDRNAFAAYTLAGQAKAVLYQVPCLCPCQKLAGHQSLLDCFVGRHGVHCHICQKEAVFCF